MYKDCLGNTYSELPRKPPQHKAKPSKGGSRKWDKSSTTWQQKVKTREAAHRAKGHRFTPYPC